MKKNIPINGITTTSAYPDGDCATMVNLRKKNGVLKPVSPRKINRTLANVYDYLFQHNLPQTGTNLLGVRNNTVYIIANDNTETALTTVSNLVSITQVGNILNVLDENGMQYLLWYNNAYVILGNMFTENPVNLDLRVEGQNYRITTAVGNNDIDSIKSILIKAKSLEQKYGRLTGYILACAVVELYDGSYILHSNPILLGQPFEKDTKFTNKNINGTIKSYNSDNIALMANITGSYTTSSNIYEEIETDYGEILNSVETYIINTNEGDVYSPVNFGLKYNASAFYIGSLAKVRAVTAANKLQYRIHTNINNFYSNIIKSVSIFMSKEISMYDLETMTKSNSDIVLSSFHNTPYSFKIKSDSDIITELQSNQQFYKVKEITFDELQTLKPNEWQNIDLKGKLGENLTMQEELTVDNFTHNSFIPNRQYVYNSKLHIWDYKTTLFKGWSYDKLIVQAGTGQIQSETMDLSDTSVEFVLQTDIKTDVGITTVISSDHKIYTPIQTLSYQLNPMISYPDSRAYKMTVWIKQTFDGDPTMYFKKKEFKLTASETHNFAYYISEDLKPIETFGDFIDVNQLPSEQNATLIYRNGLKISSVNNPIYFPAGQTHVIGTGYIRNVKSNAFRMSEGQFGQYPLIVSTDKGFVSLDTGTGLAYNSQSPASEEIPINDILCPTTIGIIFANQRGLCVFAGQKSELLTGAIEQEPAISPLNPPQGDLNISQLSFNTFLQTIKTILYDFKQNEIIIVGAGDENYVLNLDSKQIYISTEKIDIEVINSQPELLVAEGMNIKDYSRSETPETNVSFVTRPFYFGVDEEKKLQRVILRGKFYDIKNDITPFIHLYGSNDGIQHNRLRSFQFPVSNIARNHKDFDLGMMTKASFRNYTLRFEATVLETSEIQYIDTMVSDALDNDKMR